MDLPRSDLRRRVSFAQLEQLWEFLHKRRDIALGFNKSAQARHVHHKMWKEVAESLNSHEDGATKDWKGWCKYWNDYKSKLKKLAAATKSSQQMSGGESTARPLIELEIKFLQLLGADFSFRCTSEVKIEPLDEETPQEVSIVPTAAELNNSESVSTGVDLGILPEASMPVNVTLAVSPSLLTFSPRRSSQDQISNSSTPSSEPLEQPSPVQRSPQNNDRQDGWTKRTILKATRRRSPPASPTVAADNRRRRRLRREPPISADSARLALIEETKRQTRLEEEKVELLRALVSEIRDLRQIIERR